MSAGLEGVRLAIIGGDDRELYLIPELQKQGAYIIGVGMEKAPAIPDLVIGHSLIEVADQADCLIFPMFGTDERGAVKAKYANDQILLNKEVLQAIPQRVPIFIGWARPMLKSAAEILGLKIIETANLDEVAILNSIPSAEGAIQMAIAETLITIHGSESFVLGLGRTGWTLARVLKGMGANVTGVARKAADLARAMEMGIRPVHLSDLEEEIGRADIIFNTIPHLILDQVMLERIAPETVIIDLASIPGGTDFEFAKTIGVKALLAPGLPGLVAPKSAGKILAQIYPQLILRHLTTNKTGSGP